MRFLLLLSLSLTSLEISVPPCRSVSLSLNSRVSTLAEETSTDDDDIRTTSHHLINTSVLLTKTVTLVIQANTWSHDEPVKALVMSTHVSLSNESNNKVLVGFGNVDGLLSVLTSSERALRTELSEHEQTTWLISSFLSGLLETLNDTGSCDSVGISDVGPLCDFENSTGILVLDCVSNVGKLAVLKDKEVMLLSELLERDNGALKGEVVDDVDVGLDKTDVWTKSVHEGEELIGGFHVDGGTKVGLLLLHDGEKTLGKRRGVSLGSLGVTECGDHCIRVSVVVTRPNLGI